MPSSHATGAQSGWRLSGSSNGTPTSLGCGHGETTRREGDLRRRRSRALQPGVHRGRDRAGRGREVSLWLTGEAAWFGVPGRAEEFALPLATPLADLLAAVLAGGQVTVCSQCAARREIGQDDVHAGVRIAGAAVFTEEILRDGVQALVY